MSWLAIVLAAATAVHGQSVTRGPYLQLGTSTSMVVKWRTDQASESVVFYGSSPDRLTHQVRLDVMRTDHEVRLRQLEPGTRYYYAVGTAGKILAGNDATHHFTTSPPPGVAGPTRIWVLGDSGSGRFDAAAVRDAYLGHVGTRPTDLWLLLGDIAYSDGTDREFQKAFFDSYPTLLRKVVTWPTLGNHDARSSDCETETGPYYDIFTLPKHGEAGGVASGTESYYSFDYGNIHFVSLDSSESDRSPEGRMLAWLRRDLSTNDKQWLIAFLHHPPLSAGVYSSDERTALIEVRENIMPLLDEHGVDLVLAGHNHIYERSFLLSGHYGSSGSLASEMILDSGDGRPDGDGAYIKRDAGKQPGAVHVVAGTGSELELGALNHPAMYLSLASLGSLVLEIHANRLRGLFLDSAGDVRDSFVLEKRPDHHPPTVQHVEALSPTVVEVTFSEPVDQLAGSNPQHYALDRGASVLRASFVGSLRRVRLTTSDLKPAITYTLVIRGIADPSGNLTAGAASMRFTYLPLISESFQDGVAPVQDYAGTRDTYLSEQYVTLTASTERELSVRGGSRGSHAALLAWDLSRIPAQAVVESATITLQVTDPSGSGYEIYEARREWSEVDATWNECATGRLWQKPGAAGAGDRGTLTLGTVGANSPGRRSFSLNVDGVALVQSWIDRTKPNHGLLLVDPRGSDTFAFRSREAAAARQRPRVTISYRLPPDRAAED